MPDARFIAEDLGYLTDEVRELREHSGWPGMKILQYAFDTRETGDYSPYAYDANTVVYPGTHDNDSVKGWVDNAPRYCIRRAMEYIGIRSERRLPRGLVRLALQSGSNLAIIPMQDWLGLGSEARINTPATLGGNNWRWRLARNEQGSRLAGKIARMTFIYGRCPDKDEAEKISD